MTRFRLEIGKHSFHYDTDYGISKRKGWSYSHEGHFVCQFESFINMAWVAMKYKEES